MKYLVRALRAPGGVVSVEFDAADADDAGRQAQTNGLSVLSVRPKFRWRVGPLAGRSRFVLRLFNQELIALLGAGLSLVESLETLAAKESNGGSRELLARLVDHLRQGRTLSHAMHAEPQAFPPLYASTVQANERSGGLEDALKRYAAYDQQLDVVRKKIVNASIYPVLLIVAGTVVMAFLLGYVIPKFSLVYEDMHATLPFASRMLLKLGSALQNNGTAAAIILAGALLAVARFATAPGVRQRLGMALWKVPVVGARMQLYQLARFYRTLGMLLRGGTPVVAAIDMASGLLAPALRPGVAAARNAIREGRTISEAMSCNGLTTEVAVRMLRVGERSGRMDEMMERIAGFLDDEVARWVEWFTRLFEPLLMAFIGIVIGAIVVLMYLPVFELAGSLQ